MNLVLVVLIIVAVLEVAAITHLWHARNKVRDLVNAQREKLAHLEKLNVENQAILGRLRKQLAESKGAGNNEGRSASRPPVNDEESRLAKARERMSTKKLSEGLGPSSSVDNSRMFAHRERSHAASGFCTNCSCYHEFPMCGR